MERVLMATKSIEETIRNYGGLSFSIWSLGSFQGDLGSLSNRSISCGYSLQYKIRYFSHSLSELQAMCTGMVSCDSTPLNTAALEVATCKGWETCLGHWWFMSIDHFTWQGSLQYLFAIIWPLCKLPNPCSKSNCCCTPSVLYCPYSYSWLSLVSSLSGVKCNYCGNNSFVSILCSYCQCELMYSYEKQILSEGDLKLLDWEKWWNRSLNYQNILLELPSMRARLLVRRLFFADLRVAEAQTDTLVGEMARALIWTSEGVQGP